MPGEGRRLLARACALPIPAFTVRMPLGECGVRVRTAVSALESSGWSARCGNGAAAVRLETLGRSAARDVAALYTARRASGDL
ncbi:hypothetical protein KCP69_10055 [Salmonella enterica subsp. enterica]|nr:hypothetical protein KCP69_10055 [Salmonella enterica subsp. enterica]